MPLAKVYKLTKKIRNFTSNKRDEDALEIPKEFPDDLAVKRWWRMSTGERVRERGREECVCECVCNCV